MKLTNLYLVIPTLVLTTLGQSSHAKIPQRQQLFHPPVLQVAQTTSVIDEKTAFELIWKLPIVQRKAREIERLSKGTIRVTAVLDSSPTQEQPYYIIRVVENHVKYMDTIYWFRVSQSNGNIEVLDLVENQFIPLNQWKPN